MLLHTGRVVYTGTQLHTAIVCLGRTNYIGIRLVLLELKVCGVDLPPPRKLRPLFCEQGTPAFKPYLFYVPDWHREFPCQPNALEGLGLWIVSKMLSAAYRAICSASVRMSGPTS